MASQKIAITKVILNNQKTTTTVSATVETEVIDGRVVAVKEVVDGGVKQ